VRGEEKVETLAAAGVAEVLAGCCDLVAVDRVLECGKEVGLVWTGWSLLAGRKESGRVTVVKNIENILGGRQSSGCSRLKLMISAREWTFVVLKSWMNSVKHSLNSWSDLT
jgi:hypothetical protein